MIRGVLFDMDGVLVNNTQAHVKAFEIFCERYGVEDWQHKLQTAFGMGNDDIMRLILPEEIIREKGMKALGEEKEAIYREVYAPEIRPVRGLVELLEELRPRWETPLSAAPAAKWKVQKSSMFRLHPTMPMKRPGRT